MRPALTPGTKDPVSPVIGFPRRSLYCPLPWGSPPRVHAHCLSELLVALASAQPGFGGPEWGLGSPWERMKSGQQPQGGNQEHLNEVQRKGCCARDHPLEPQSGKRRVSRTGGLHHQSTVIAEKEPHSSHLTGSLDSFLVPQGSGL